MGKVLNPVSDQGLTHVTNRIHNELSTTLERMETPRRASQRVKDNLRNKLIKLALEDDDETRRTEFKSTLIDFERSVQVERPVYSATKTDLRSAKKKLNDDNDDWGNERRHAEREGSPEYIQALNDTIEDMKTSLRARMKKHEKNTIDGIMYVLKTKMHAHEWCSSKHCIINKIVDENIDIKAENETLNKRLETHISIAKEILSIAAKLKKLTVD